MCFSLHFLQSRLYRGPLIVNFSLMHENLVNFPLINSQDFYGFLFSSDVHHRFTLQDFPTFDGHISPYHCARNFDIVKLTYFYLSVLLNYYAHTYSFFDNISHSVCKKTVIYSLEFPLFVF